MKKIRLWIPISNTLIDSPSKNQTRIIFRVFLLSQFGWGTYLINMDDHTQNSDDSDTGSNGDLKTR